MKDHKQDRPPRPSQLLDGANKPVRKPRILVAGEFSAGKTQLINGLLGDIILPSNVTATALPPVWLVEGTNGQSVIDLKGKMRDVKTLDGVSVEDTQFCIAARPAAFLDSFDIIDTPGNSDPNIPPECWERMLDYADMVVWCSNATQAWRQSEKSVWKEMPERLRHHATILITHADRIIDERSASRVLRRVKREAADFFDHFMMVSLLKDDDLDSIAEHLKFVGSSLPELGGKAHPAVRGFATTYRSPPGKRATEGEVKPRRIAGSAAPLTTPPPAPPSKSASAPDAEAVTESGLKEPVRVAVQDDDDDRAKTRRGNVLSLKIAAKSSANATGEDGQDAATARQLWDRLSDGVDMTDADAVLICVNKMIAEIDGPATTGDDQQNSEELDEAAESELVRDAVNRWKS